MLILIRLSLLFSLFFLTIEAQEEEELSQFHPSFFTQADAFEALDSVRFVLRPIAPEWRIESLQIWPDGSPRIIQFIDPASQWPMKRIEYYEGGFSTIFRESDFFAPTIGQFSDTTLLGAIDGVDISYYPNGSPSSITTYSRGKKHGIEKKFYKSGSIQLSRQYVDDVIIGDELLFWPEETGRQGQIFEKKTFDNGVAEGPFFQFSKSGERVIEGFYKNGLFHGKMVSIELEKKEEKIVFWYFGLLSDCGGSPAYSIRDLENTKQLLEERHYSMGSPHGTWREWYKSGAIKKRAFYRYGMKEGLIQEYNEIGEINKTGSYSKGIPTGTHSAIDGPYRIEERYPDTKKKDQISSHTITYQGKPFVSYSKLNGAISGRFTTFYPESNQIHKQFFFREGSLDGEQREYYLSGNLASLFYFKKGRWYGEQYEWDEDGHEIRFSEWNGSGLHGKYRELYTNNPSQVAFTAFFSDGCIDGPYEKWYDNGQRKELSFWEKGKRIGESKKWDESSGVLIERVSYSNGFPCGPWTEWYPTGQVKKEYLFSEGALKGRGVEWYKNGQKAVDENYHEGLLSGEKKEWSQDGFLLFQGSYKEGKSIGIHRSFYLNSNQLSIEEQFDTDGLYDGIQKSYYPNGQIQTVAPYLHGVLDGVKERYTESGKKIVSLSYSKGLLQGPYMRLLPNEMIECRLYENGLPAGKWTIFSRDEQTGEERIYSQALYKEGLLTGEYLEYYENGQKFVSISFVQGIRNGKAIIYNMNGIPRVSTEYVDGMQEGEMLLYAPSGFLSKRSHFHQNHLHGEEISYHENGEKKTVSFYKNGFLDGPVAEYSDKGVLLYEGVYVEGKRHGIFRKYNSDGTVKAEFVYDSDRIVKKNRK